MLKLKESFNGMGLVSLATDVSRAPNARHLHCYPPLSNLHHVSIVSLHRWVSRSLAFYQIQNQDPDRPMEILFLHTGQLNFMMPIEYISSTMVNEGRHRCKHKNTIYPVIINRQDATRRIWERSSHPSHQAQLMFPPAQTRSHTTTSSSDSTAPPFQPSAGASSSKLIRLNSDLPYRRLNSFVTPGTKYTSIKTVLQSTQHLITNSINNLIQANPKCYILLIRPSIMIINQFMNQVCQIGAAYPPSIQHSVSSRFHSVIHPS